MKLYSDSAISQGPFFKAKHSILSKTATYMSRIGEREKTWSGKVSSNNGKAEVKHKDMTHWMGDCERGNQNQNFLGRPREGNTKYEGEVRYPKIPIWENREWGWELRSRELGRELRTDVGLINGWPRENERRGVKGVAEKMIGLRLVSIWFDGDS